MPYPHHLHPADGSCRCNPAAAARPGFQLVEIIIFKEELYHDIDHDTYQLERARQPQQQKNGAPGGASVEFATDDTSRYMLDRYIDRYFSQAVTRMSAYLLLPSRHAHSIANNHTKGWQEKSILLALPKRWPPHLIDPLRDAVHQLIVKGTEKDYLSYVLGANDPLIALLDDDLDDADRQICANINTRYGPMTAPMTFGA